MVEPEDFYFSVHILLCKFKIIKIINAYFSKCECSVATHITNLTNFNHCGRCVMVSYCGFNSHFLD